MIREESRKEDRYFMRRAMDLAGLGRGAVSPNPMVGCVIVNQGKIIGEGYHIKYGGPHAEPHAINGVKDPNLLKTATLYVTLEPCSHFGKTPPCADLIIDHQLKRVVIGAKDSNPLVGGKGIKKLIEAGIEVEEGVMAGEIRKQNARFFTYMEKQRPYVVLKWAQTKDGFVARTNYDSKWISQPLSRQLVHRWRAEEDAIIVGAKTAQYDNPRLNVRDWTGKNPVRIVIDKGLSLDRNLFLFDGSQATLCFNLIRAERKKNLECIKMEKNFTIGDLLNEMYQRKIQSLIVEGGSQLLRSFLEAGLWDEARVFTGDGIFGKGIPAPVLRTVPVSRYEIMGDVLQHYINHE